MSHHKHGNNQGNGGSEPVRVGVYTCYCGSNIAAMVDVEAVAKFAEKLPGVVVSRAYKYMCSDPGQELIAQDIKEHKLNRIVVAACSPLLHEHTFRTATGRAGLNPYFLHMVSIREHASWVHDDKANSTEKAKEILQGAVARVALHKALEKAKVPVNPDVLVVGGGIAGIHAALTLANANKKVILVERDATIGGHMAKFDKTFPTLDCAACILTPKMSAVRAHPNITLKTWAEVTKVEGYVGNFKVQIKQKPRYINEDLCVGCMECIKACVFKEPKFSDEFNQGLGKRKPVYIPFPQAVPPVVLVDPATCLKLKTGKCKQTCVEACGERKAFDFEQKETFEEVQVGTVIVATGFKTFDAGRQALYGYGVYPEVYTALEIERLINASGPTGGHLVTKKGEAPKSVAIIHCVGSRDEHTNKWCSRVCCMYSLKLAHMIKAHTTAQVYNFYIDMRAAGKGYEEFYNRVLEEGVQFIRGRVAEVTDWAMTPDEEGRLVVRAEDTLAGFVRRIPADMVVLATGLEPHKDAQDVRRMFNMSCSGEGFFLERHPKLAPVNTPTDGIFLAGACQGPKDIPDTVAQAGAAAAEALALIDRGHVEIEPNTAYVVEEECSGCKTCLSMCPYTAITRDEVKKKAVINPAMCKGCGTCVAACPSGSIRQNLFEDEQVLVEIEEVLTRAA
ncbi:MAG: CoB--CoM heterodisulfide reductase iron-sulfur subunit A family protein [Elusimicrobiota bacterium]|jgi:heterodisulfide reductase subunit A